MNPSRLAGRARGLRRFAAVALLAGHALAASAADIVVGQVAPLTGVLASTGMIDHSKSVSSYRRGVIGDPFGSLNQISLAKGGPSLSL